MSIFKRPATKQILFLSTHQRTMSSLSPRPSVGPPSFSFINSSPESVHQEAHEIKQRFTDAIDNIKKSSSKNAFEALSLALGEASAASARVTLPSMVHGDVAVRAASHAAKDDFKNMFDAALSDVELYNALVNIKDENFNHEEDERFKRNILRTLRRNGCGLESTSDQSTIQTKRQQIEETCTAFCAAINEHDEYLLFTEEELDGISDIGRFAIDETTGKRKLGLKAPDILPVLKFATNPNTRKQVAQAMSKKCQEENTPRFLEVLKLRDECAKLLEYLNHGNYMCETKMVGTPENAEEFLLELADAYEPMRKRELELLLDMKRKDVGSDDINLDSWDVMYYTRMYKAECAGVDEAAMRPYFPLLHVKETILSIYEELLGLKFVRVSDAKVWHDDVECYAVCTATSDGSGGEVLGHFYLDIFPRKGKYSHQCVYPLSPSFNVEGGRVLPACVNIGNLTPSREGAPSLLMFREVETFFHEVNKRFVIGLYKRMLHCSSYDLSPNHLFSLVTSATVS